MRTYTVIEVSGLNESLFNSLKSEGVEQTSLQTIRKSLDESKGILKWSGERPASIDSLNILFEGSLVELQSFLDNEIEDWQESQGV